MLFRLENQLISRVSMQTPAGCSGITARPGWLCYGSSKVASGASTVPEGTAQTRP